MSAESIQTQPTTYSCRRCGRVVTKREQHEELEARVLEAIRAGRPEWADDSEETSADGAPHVERFRELLRMRKERGEGEGAERMRASVRRQQQITFALQIIFAVVAVALMALLAPADWQHFFQGSAWRTKR